MDDEKKANDLAIDDQAHADVQSVTADEAFEAGAPDAGAGQDPDSSMVGTQKSDALRMRQKAIERIFKVQRLTMALDGRRGPGQPGHGMRSEHRGQGRVLALLALKPKMTQREMNGILDMSRQSLAELLARMERDGLVERQASQQDRRVMEVSLTEKGMDAAKRSGDRRSPAVAALDALSDEEVVQLNGLLDHVVESMRAALPADFAEHERRMREFMNMRGHGAAPDRFGQAGKCGPAGEPGDRDGGVGAPRGFGDSGCAGARADAADDGHHHRHCHGHHGHGHEHHGHGHHGYGYGPSCGPDRDPHVRGFEGGPHVATPRHAGFGEGGPHVATPRHAGFGEGGPHLAGPRPGMW